jgi:transcriptional regulator with XRE-family HTH domain
VPPQTGVDQSLAKTLRSLRVAQELGQEGLAHAAGVSVATYARIERGQVNPTWTTVRRIVAALGLTFGEFAAAMDAIESR